MKVALGQFAVSSNWEENIRTCGRLMEQARDHDASLLVLPEGVLARDITDPKIVLKAAQPLDGPFMSALVGASRGSGLTTMTSIHVPAGEARVFNTQVAIRDGRIIASYRKLHLYDAFSSQESENVEAGDALPPIVEVGGLKVGMMTCYDVRFPEVARRLAVDGAEVIALPSAWVRGLGKEAHWEVLVTARALENTCYVVAVGECGARNIGASMVVDPLGVAVARAGEAPALVFAELDPARISHARAVLPVLANRRFARPELAERPAAGDVAAA